MPELMSIILLLILAFLTGVVAGVALVVVICSCMMTGE